MYHRYQLQGTLLPRTAFKYSLRYPANCNIIIFVPDTVLNYIS